MCQRTFERNIPIMSAKPSTVEPRTGSYIWIMYLCVITNTNAWVCSGDCERKQEVDVNDSWVNQWRLFPEALSAAFTLRHAILWRNQQTHWQPICVRNGRPWTRSKHHFLLSVSVLLYKYKYKYKRSLQQAFHLEMKAHQTFRADFRGRLWIEVMITNIWQSIKT